MPSPAVSSERQYQDRPSREAMAALPVFAGLAASAIRVIHTEADAAEAGAVLRASDVLGFDTESKPTFAPGERSSGPHLIQLATADRAFLFRAERGPGLDVLREAVQSPVILKVGFGLSSDRGPLASKLGIRLHHALDLCPVFRRLGYRQRVGLPAAVAIVLGQRLAKSKRVQTSNWAARTLSPAQCLYAANDAYASLRVYFALRAQQPGLLPPRPASVRDEWCVSGSPSAA